MSVRQHYGRKVLTNLDSILKSRDITLPTNVYLVKAMVFPVVMYGCESWTVKKAECRRIDAFELWCWRRLLRVPWTARRSNLKEISPGCSLEGLMKLQYFGHLMQRVDSLEKILMLGGIGGRRRRGWQSMRWLDGIIDSMDMGLVSGSWWWTGRPGVLQFMGSQRVGHDWATGLTDASAAVMDHAEACPRSEAAAKRSYSTSEVRGSSRERQPHSRGQRQRPRGAIPRSRSGGAAVRSYTSSKVRSSGCALLEQPWRDTPRPR